MLIKCSSLFIRNLFKKFHPNIHFNYKNIESMYRKDKNFFKIISNLYSGKLILVFLAIFLIIRIQFIQVIPDFLKLGEIESPQSYILRLLSIVIGFSSFILTILLLAYNTFSKKIRMFKDTNPNFVRFIKNFTTEDYAKVMKN